MSRKRILAERAREQKNPASDEVHAGYMRTPPPLTSVQEMAAIVRQALRGNPRSDYDPEPPTLDEDDDIDDEVLDSLTPYEAVGAMLEMDPEVLADIDGMIREEEERRLRPTTVTASLGVPPQDPPDTADPPPESE